MAEKKDMTEVKKLYRVNLVSNIVVMAENIESAMDVSVRSAADGIIDKNEWSVCDIELIETAEDLPEGWSKNSLPYSLDMYSTDNIGSILSEAIDPVEEIKEECACISMYIDDEMVKKMVSLAGQFMSSIFNDCSLEVFDSERTDTYDQLIRAIGKTVINELLLQSITSYIKTHDL